MNIDPRIAEYDADIRSWRQHIHANPETAFEEHSTSKFVAERLSEFGIEVDQGLAGTGVVGTIHGRHAGNGAIGLRADMDALKITEATGLPYRSKNFGKMHACGHDGHTAMLLGAARRLAENPDFAGTVHLIFQPAEEAGGGGRVMVEQGLFEKFPVDAVYGMHNWPGMPVGNFAIRSGPFLAASAWFDVSVTGKSAHAAMPHQGVNALLAASRIVDGLQPLTRQSSEPGEASVVTVTRLKSGDAWNVIPDKAQFGGIARFFSDAVGEAIEAGIRKAIDDVCAPMGAEARIAYNKSYPATVNTSEETQTAIKVASGIGSVEENADLVMGSEDFSYMLQARPGCFILCGNGPGDNGRELHSPNYDFNDDALAPGSSYWVNLVKTVLTPSGNNR